MQTLAHPQVVKVTSIVLKTTTAQACSTKTMGQRFLAIFLSCLSTWGT